MGYTHHIIVDNPIAKSQANIIFRACSNILFEQNIQAYHTMKSGCIQAVIHLSVCVALKSMQQVQTAKNSAR
jgi:hypothetical protein